MTVLSACQDAAKEMGLTAPSSIYTSSDTFAKELGALAIEAASYIAKQHDWRLFVTLNTFTGDGAKTDFTMPADYDRMPVKAEVWRSTTLRPMESVLDLDTWLLRRLRNINALEGEWIILTGAMQIYPVMSASETAKFYYCSNKIVMASDGRTAKAAFTADTDTFRLPERLLKLVLKWKWRAMKKLDSADEQEEFEIAQAQEIKADKGSRILHVGKQRLPDGTTWAYPGVISA